MANNDALYDDIKIFGTSLDTFTGLHEFIRIKCPGNLASFEHQYANSSALNHLYMLSKDDPKMRDFKVRNQCNVPGAKLMLSLQEATSDTNEASPGRMKDELIEDLERAFSSEYMDAEGTVGETVLQLLEYMDLYAAEKGRWVAPYTSFVTSSMMGKSRHMKEVANHLPSVYICLRREPGGYGYPHQSPSIVKWLSTGAVTIVGKRVIDYYHCFSTLRWSAFIISTISLLATWINDRRFFESLDIADWEGRIFEFGWLWKFFAEPPEKSKLEAFWLEVQEATRLILLRRQSGNSAHAYFQKVHTTDVRNALKQLRLCFGKHQINDNSLPLIFIFDEARTLCDYEAYNGARNYEDHTFNFHETKLPKNMQDNPSPFRSFSNFYALRRSLRYLSADTGEVPRVFAIFTDTTSRITNFQPASWKDPSLRVPSLPGPGEHQFRPIFVFSSVDVYSRVLNKPMCISSPKEVADPERLLKFGRAGWYSVYFHGNLEDRAKLPNLAPASTDAVLNTATSKLLCTPDLSLHPFNASFPLAATNLIKLIAVLAPRLALTIGPYTLEASELIASHLAVLTRTDDERHFLRTVYPSEPVLAEVSARLTHTFGWAHPLSALVHYVQGGIVDAGFKGELITKIVCLMAMDEALSSMPPQENRWKFSQPIPVSHFLDHLIVPLRGYSTFSEGLKGVQDQDNILHGTLNVDNEKLQRFLSGYVFFNHFVRVDVKLSYSMLVHAWNRGAAIMCMTNTKGIDYVIPVMLDTTSEIEFGPLHGSWEPEHIQQARRHISYILINSRNYASGKDQIGAAWAAKFSAKNLREYAEGFQAGQATEQDPFNVTESDGETMPDDLDVDSQFVWEDGDDLNAAVENDEELEDVEMDELETENVFMSLVQDFGKKRRKEQWVIVGSVLRTYTHPRRAQLSLKRPPLNTQFIVVLKGIGTDTYACLKSNPREAEDSTSNRLRERSRRYLKELTSAKVDYVDKKEKWKRAAGMQNIPLVYGDSMLGSENWVQQRPELVERWQAEQEAYGRIIEPQEPLTHVAGDVAFAESMEEIECSSTG